jgi:preprotein translocase subunit SecG
LSNVAIKGSLGTNDSKLLQGDDIETTVPESLPEALPTTDEAAPVENQE